MLKLTGAIFLAIGLAAGAALVGAPFGVFGMEGATAAAWLLFPGGFLAGAVLLALGDSRASLGWLWRLCASALLVLATASALGILMPVVGFAEPVGHTLSLWYVLGLAGVVGTACALAPVSPAAAP